MRAVIVQQHQGSQPQETSEETLLGPAELLGLQHRKVELGCEISIIYAVVKLLRGSETLLET